eukprot:2503711-Pleurochrysis_carterae.AAC.4
MNTNARARPRACVHAGRPWRFDRVVGRGRLARASARAQQAPVHGDSAHAQGCRQQGGEGGACVDCGRECALQNRAARLRHAGARRVHAQGVTNACAARSCGPKRRGVE